MVPRAFAWNSRKIGLVAAVTPLGQFDSHGRPLRLTQASNQGTVTTRYFTPWRRSDAASPYNGANLADQYRNLAQKGTALSVLIWPKSTSTNNTTFRNYVSADDHGAGGTGFVVRYNYTTGTIQYVTQQGGGASGNELTRGIAPTNTPATNASEHVFVGTVTSFNSGYVVDAYINQRLPIGGSPTTLSSAASTNTNYFPSITLPIQIGLSNPTGGTAPRASRSVMKYAEIWMRYLPPTQAWSRVHNPQLIHG